MLKHDSLKGAGQRSDNVVSAAIGDLPHNEKTVSGSAGFFGSGRVAGSLKKARFE
jgi:hypothetical protein